MRRATAAAALLLVLALRLSAAQRIVRRAQECASFTPTICAIPDVHVEGRHCHPKPCAFDVAREFFCPLVAGGYYSYQTGGEGGGCPDPFMAQAHHLPPPCGARCCRTDHAGAFAVEDPEDPTSNAAEEDQVAPDFHPSRNASPPPADAGAPWREAAASGLPHGAARYSFEPDDSTCRYKEIGRGQLMRFLATHNSSLLVMGDSTMRQLYLRLVAMLRGQARQLDFHVHTHLHFQFCREVDFLRLAANNPSGGSAALDARFLHDVVPAFFRMEVGPGQADAKRVLAECSRPPLQANYLQAPLWRSQLQALPRYLGGLPPGQRPVVVLSVGYWQGGEGVPREYLSALGALRDSVVRLFFVGVPVADVVGADVKRRLEARNAAVKAWTEAQGPPFAFVDFEALARAGGAPRGTLGSKHFACWVDWLAARFPAGAAGNPAGGGQLLGRLERVHVTQDGQCSDEMDRNVWQLILNALLDSSGAQQMGE